MASSAVKMRSSLCVFDATRHVKEGEEEGKTLCFLPASSPAAARGSVVGLAMGLLTFSRVFSPTRPVEAMHATGHRVIFNEFEKDLWAVLVLPTEVATATELRDAALQMVLQETYELFRLLHGSIRTRLAQSEEGGHEAVQQRLLPFLADLWARLSSGKKAELGQLANGLSARKGIPLLPLSRSTFLTVQSIVHTLRGAYCGGTVRNTMLLFDNQVVWTGLEPDDSVTLYSFAARCLTPSVTNTSTASRIRSSLARTSLTSTTEFYAAVGTPFRPSDWKVGADGFVTPGDATAQHDPPSWPLLHLSNGQSYRLLVYQQEMMTVLLLLDDERMRAHQRQLCAHVTSLMGPRLRPLEANLAEHFSNPLRWHVSGYRYLFHDRPNRTVRCSPSTKMTNLSRDSLAVLAALKSEEEESRVRAQYEAERAHARDGHHGSDGGGTAAAAAVRGDDEPPWEVCVRTHHDAWIVLRRNRGRELHTILGKAGETLMDCHAQMQWFSERSFGGIFNVD